MRASGTGLRRYAASFSSTREPRVGNGCVSFLPKRTCVYRFRRPFNRLQTFRCAKGLPGKGLRGAK
jgi:hypothetical protein